MKLYTETIGDGRRTAALVHGMNASKLHWHDFARLLVEEHDCTVTLVDLRGHGDSPRADRYDVDDFGADLVETLPQGLDFLIGQSLGGRAVINAAPGLQPKRLIPLDPGLQATKGFEILVKYFFWADKVLPRRTKERLVLGKNPPIDVAAAMARMDEGREKWDSNVRKGILGSIFAKPYVAEAPVVPSTMVVPEKSIVVPPPLVDTLRSLGWDIRVMPGVTHELHVQNPAGVLELLSDLFTPVTER